MPFFVRQSPLAILFPPPFATSSTGERRPPYAHVETTATTMFKKPKNRAKSRVAIRRKQQARSDSNSDSDGDGDGDNNAAHNNNAAHDAAHDLSVKKEEEKEGTDALGSGNGDAPEDKKEEEESSTTLDRILQTKKRRKLKNALLRQGGVGAAAAKKRRIADHPIKDEGEGDDAGNNDTNDNARDALVSGGGSSDLRQRLQGTFGGGNDGSSSAVDGEGAGEGVLGQKHRAAMDKYIQERMDSTNGKDGRDGTQDKAGADRQLLLDEDALYRQVAAEVGVAGMVQATMATAAPAVASATADNKTTTKEDDVGAGGMMLAGTGIAEVALPVDERIRTVRETELLASSATAGTSRGRGRDRMVVGASMAHAHPSNDRSAGSAGGPSMNDRDLQAMLPTSFGGGKKNKKQGLDRTQDIAGMAVPQTTAATAASAAPGRKPPVASSAGAAVLPTDVADLSQSYSHNFKLHTHQWVADRKTEQQREVDRVRKEQEERDGTVENRARVGFEQARRVARGGEMAGGGGSGGGGSGGGGVGGGSGSHVTTGGMAGGGGDRNRSSDDRVWRSFVSKQRNRR